MITDAQVHLWDQANPDDTVAPMTAERFTALMQANGVDRAVIIPPLRPGAAAYARAVAAREPTRYAVIDWFRPDEPDMLARLRQWSSEPNVLGARLELVATRWETWLATGVLHDLFTTAIAQNMVVLVFSRTSLSGLSWLLTRYPEARVVLEHCNLIAAQPHQYGARIAELLSFSAYPNVAVKLSALPRWSSEAYPFADMHEYLRQIYDAFGPRRLCWGSDYTMVYAARQIPYADHVNLIREAAASFLPAADIPLILGGALERWFGWPAAA